MSLINSILERIEKEKIKTIDLKYSDLIGRWYHITFPARRFKEVVEEGIPFDGSSIPGMKSVESGDMVIIPDLESGVIDPFCEQPTLRFLCYICDADTRVGVKKDSRSVAKRAFDYMLSTQIADESLWVPEFEFYLFNEAKYKNNPFDTGFSFSSKESKKSLPNSYEDNEGLSQEFCKGYHIDTPFDRHFEIREEMADAIEYFGIPVRYHHHEVGMSGQHEIETELIPFPFGADAVMTSKDVIRKVALNNGLTATFMPKPIYNEAGTGLHFHIMLKKDGKNLFYKKGGYADLSDEAIWFIGGILKHGESLAAFTNPSTNSYKRLLPGFEAPVKLFYGLANRSAAIRIPKYATTEKEKRIEFRTGDATCNPYLAMSALLMAGLDGIKNKINPLPEMGPFDENIFNWPKEKKDKLKSIPESLKEALEALKKDYFYLLDGGVFNEELIESWIVEKEREISAVQSRPTSLEMSLYYDM